MPRAVKLFITLSVAWLLLSGMFQPLLLGFGVVSALFVTWIAIRMDNSDGTPCHVPLRWHAVPGYLLWLAREVVMSNVDVMRRVLGMAPVDPAVVEVPIFARSDYARVVFTNSVTLTPGTLTISVDGDRALVHALSSAGADALLSGDMSKRVAALESAAAVESAAAEDGSVAPAP